MWVDLHIFSLSLLIIVSSMLNDEYDLFCKRDQIHHSNPYIIQTGKMRAKRLPAQLHTLDTKSVCEVCTRTCISKIV